MKTNIKVIFGLILIFSLSTVNLYGQEKKKVNSVDDIPKFTYELKGKASEVFASDKDFKELYLKVKADQEKVLSEYEITDNTLLKGIYSTLASIDVLEGNNQAALDKFLKIKELQEKPAAKLTSGLISSSRIEAEIKAGGNSDDIPRHFRVLLAEKVNALPWDVVQDEVKSTKGMFEIRSENLIKGMIMEQIDPVLEKSDGKLSSDFANGMIGMKYSVDYILPLKTQIVEVYTEYINAHKVHKDDIWAARDKDLHDSNDLHKVVVAIWDSGVDTVVFKDHLFVNGQEKYDGIDNDNNGFVDDVHGIAYDLHANKVGGLLYPLTDEQKTLLPQMTDMMKGISDLQANLDSEEAGMLKKRLSVINPQQVKPFIEELGLFGNYAHGTHVAGITAKGNPGIVIMPSRLTFGFKMMPECPTIEQAKKDAIQAKETVAYYKQNNVRVVNMSFGGDVQSVEQALEMNGKGATPEERKELAREIFDIGKDAFYEAIESAPEILFIAAAGNSDEDAEFYEAIPSSFNLPNILTVGAVDQAGEETDFTSFGENVDVHANGFEVESYIPGGKKMKMSGTSMASPNVANLAAKLIALNPDLTVAQTIDIIKKGSDVSEDGRRVLINPRKSIDLLKKY